MALGGLIGRLWLSVDVHNLAVSLPGFYRDATALVDRFALSSAALARREYEARRAAAGIRSPFTVPPVDGPSVEQVGSALGWATKDLRALSPDVKPEHAALVVDAAKTKAEGALERLVLNAGRETIVNAVREDRQARAWARETRPGCCYFCAMLATRGAVYKSAHAAGENNAYHDHDRCVPVPVFGEYEPTAHARQWAADWSRVTKGLSGDSALLAWRQHFEGRTPTN